VSGAEIADYFKLLEPLGWTCEAWQAQDGSRWYKAHSSPPYPPCELRAGRSHGYVLLEALLAVRPLPECEPALWRYLLLLNGALKAAKFSLGPAGTVLLATELASAGCTFAGFREAVTALRTYGAHFRREIEMLASQTSLASAWLSLTPRQDLPRIDIVSRARES
jgi:hypothetical protein